MHHVQWIEPGTKAKHATRINDTTLYLELAITLAEEGTYRTDFRIERKQGTELPVSVKPGTQLTPQQMRSARRNSK